MTTQRMRLAKSAAIAGFLLLALPNVVACRNFDRVEQHGVYTLSLHMHSSRLRWEGGTTGLSSSSLCSSVDDKCIEAWDIQVEPSTYKPAHPRIAVRSFPDRDSDQPPATAFFDASTGATLHCGNCAPDVERKLGSFSWGSTQDAGVAYLSKGKGLLSLVLLEFSGTNYQVTELGTWPASDLFTDNLKFAAGDAGVAWYVCTPHCTLHAFLRDTRSAVEVPVPSQCPRSGYLDIGWSQARPFPQFYWGAQEKDMCLQADGRPALPRGAPPR